MTLLIAFLTSLAAAFVVITVAQTAAAYPGLPDRVPIGFGYDGRIRFASRPTIWLLAVAQIFTAGILSFAGYAIATGMPGTHGTLLGLTIAAACITAIIWRAKSLLLSVAKSGQNRVALSGFWLFCGACFALILFAAFVIG